MFRASRTLTALLLLTCSLAVACTVDRSGFARMTDGDAPAVAPPAGSLDGNTDLDATPTPGAPFEAGTDAGFVAPDLGPRDPPPPPPAPPPPPPPTPVPPPDAGPECEPGGCCPPCPATTRCMLTRCVPVMVECGHEGLTCCVEEACDPGLGCNRGVCSRCGVRPGDDCCDDGSCGPGMSCDFFGGTRQCYLCGAEGQWCCQADPPCGPRLRCDFWGDGQCHD